MKKLFRQKIDQSNKDQTHGSFLGKVFVVGRHTVTVEEVIAEGKYLPLSYRTMLCFEVVLHV